MVGTGAGLAETGTDVVGVVMADEVVPDKAACFRPMAGVNCVGCGELGAAAGTGRAVDEGGAKFARLRGWFVGNYREVIGDLLSVAVLVIVVVWDVAGLSAVVRGCRRRVLRVVVRELAPADADHGSDPVGEGALTLSFRRRVRVGSGGCW